MALTNPMQHRARKGGGSGRRPPIDVGAEYRRAFGAYIRECRHMRSKAHGGPMTQEELAAELGLSHSAISGIETGRNSLSPERLMETADALGVKRSQFALVYLRWTNPWVYFLVHAPNDQSLQRELKAISERVGLDVFRGPSSKDE